MDSLPPVFRKPQKIRKRRKQLTDAELSALAKASMDSIGKLKISDLAPGYQKPDQHWKGK